MANALPSLPTAKQAEFLQALASRRYRYLLFGGGTGGGKSYLGAKIFINLAMTQPGTTYGIFRKNMVTLKRTTLRTFQKYARVNGYVEGRDYEFNKQDMTWTFANGSIIYFMELDVTKDPELNKLGGLELTAAMIDEADEVDEAGFNVLRFRIGRNNFNDELAFIYLTCNPNQSWVRYLFYEPDRKGLLAKPFYFLESLITDNTYQSTQALEAASDPTAPQQYVERYFRGNWDYINDPNALFPNHVIDAALVDRVPSGGSPSAAADVAREGDDNNVFAALAGGLHVYDLTVPDIDTGDEIPILNQVADEFIAYFTGHKVGYQRATVDAVGLGAGVVDNSRKRGYFVQSFKSGERATALLPCTRHGSKTCQVCKDRRPMFDNLRSQRYWEYAQALRDGSAKIDKNTPHLEELRRDLLAHTFVITDSQIIVESKAKIKKRLHRSPDYSDAVVMAYRPEMADNANQAIVTGDYFEDYDED